MSEIHFGEILPEDLEDIEFSVPDDAFFIWRETEIPQAIFCSDRGDIPLGWLTSPYSLKICGDFATIKKVLQRFDLPAGSKIVGLGPQSKILVSMTEKKIRFSGIRTKRVLIVDDSPTMRKLLRHFITSIENWEVIAELEDPRELPKAIDEFYPDLVTLDLNLGEINGVEAMKRFLAPRKMATLIVTSQNINDGSLVMEALSAGAIDYIQKPESGKWDSMKEEFQLKLETSLKAKWSVVDLKSSKLIKSTPIDFDASKFLILIGSSTGGTQALQEIFCLLPENIPPILVTQHIPAGFSKALADRLNTLCPFEVKEAEDGDEIRPGRILIAPGNHHMKLAPNKKQVMIVNEPPINRFRPSVEAMFSSFEGYKSRKLIAVMLTGMGKDGAEAMLRLRKEGALTIAQDEQSSVVFGMPREAIRIGAAENVKPLLEIPKCLLGLMSSKK